jgi:hypothetical protein
MSQQRTKPNPKQTYRNNKQNQIKNKHSGTTDTTGSKIASNHSDSNWRKKVIGDPTEPNMNMGNEAMIDSDSRPKLNVVKHLEFRQIISFISFPFVSFDCV